MRAPTTRMFLFVQLIAFAYSAKDRCPNKPPLNQITDQEELKDMEGYWYTYAVVGNAQDFQHGKCVITKHEVEGLKQSIELTVRNKTDFYKVNAVFKHFPNDLNMYDYIFTNGKSYRFALIAYNFSKYSIRYSCEEIDSKVSEIYFFMKRDDDPNLDSEESEIFDTSIKYLDLQNEPVRKLDMNCKQD